MNLFVLLELTGEIHRGIQFRAEKIFLTIKCDFFEFLSIPGGKYQIAMTRFLLEGV